VAVTERDVTRVSIALGAISGFLICVIVGAVSGNWWMGAVWVPVYVGYSLFLVWWRKRAEERRGWRERGR
jgi:hypothetical protein